VTDGQTSADSVCYQTVIKYVKVRTNEHMKCRKCFHGHYNIPVVCYKYHKNEAELQSEHS